MLKQFVKKMQDDEKSKVMTNTGPKLDLKKFRDERRALAEIVEGMIDSKRKESRLFGKLSDLAHDDIEGITKDWPVFNKMTVCKDAIKQTALYAGQAAHGEESIDLEFIDKIESLIEDSSYVKMKQERPNNDQEKGKSMVQSFNVALSHQSNQKIVNYLMDNKEKHQHFCELRNQGYDGKKDKVDEKTLQSIGYFKPETIAGSPRNRNKLK